jgi:hypothetical protein
MSGHDGSLTDELDDRDVAVPPPTPAAPYDAILQRLDKIEAALADLLRMRTVKDWYTTEEVAALVGKAEFTVREWCRHRRIRAEKRGSGRGAHPSWVVSHDELLRYQREGLLPSAAK